MGRGDFRLERFDQRRQGVELPPLLERELAAGERGLRLRLRGSSRGLRHAGRSGQRPPLPEPVGVAPHVFLHGERRSACRRLEHERARDNVVEKCAVVAHHEHGARKFHESFLQHLERLGVEVVGGLVEHDQVGRLGEQPSEEHAVPLPPGEKLHQRAGAIGREQKILQVADHVPGLAGDLHRLVAVGHVVGHGLLVVELIPELVEEGDPQVGAEPYGALRRCQLAEQQPHERGLASAVGADDADSVAPHHRRGEVADDRPRLPSKRHSLQGGHERTAPLRLVDLERHAAHHVPALPALPPHRLQRPHPPLVAGAAGLDAGADPGLFLGELLVKQRVLLLLRRKCLLLAEQKRVVVARPVEQSAAVDLQDAGGHAAEKRPVVGDEHERSPPAAQELLQPFDGLDVEVVGGLVEQEQVGL